jgi:hypothetical protein
LQEAKEYAQLCTEVAASAFQFMLEVPDPFPENSYGNGKTQLTQIVSYKSLLIDSKYLII